VVNYLTGNVPDSPKRLQSAKLYGNPTYPLPVRNLPLPFGFVAPPMPQWMFGWFVDDDTEKYSYCSHGCIRISNKNIKKLFTLALKERHKNPRRVIYIHISK